MTLINQISARCNATLRDEVKAGIRQPCADGECVVASIAGEPVTLNGYDTAVKAFGLNVIAFNESRKALPHPGHLFNVNYCTECGTDVKKFHGNVKKLNDETWERIEARAKQ